MGDYENKPDPLDVRLNDGSPLYHALLNESTAGIVDKKDGENAREAVNEIARTHGKALLALQGKTKEEARAVLDSLLRKAA